MIQHLYYFSVFNETTDPHGRPIQWIPYGKDDKTNLSDLYPRYMVPVPVDRYEIKFDVIPIPTTSTTTSTTTPIAFPTTPEEHAALLNCAPEDIPAHLKPQFAPKLLREGSTVRLYQWRYDEQRKAFCWQSYAQPIRPPTTTQVNPQLRITCPGLDKKFMTEEIIDFTRHYNLRPDGTYYRATPERIYDGRGYGPHGLPAPTTAGKSYIIIFCLLYQHQIETPFLELKLAYKNGFRWRPVGYPVAPTPTSSLLSTPWSTFPIFASTPSDPHTPSGSGLDSPTWTTPETPAALPWSTAPVPSLPTTTPPVYWHYDKTLDLRKSQDHMIRKVSEPLRPSRPTRSRPPRQPSRPAPQAPPQPAAPPVPALVVAPVRVTGVPGSSHDGVNLVSDDINTVFSF